jgi:carbon-monoxide dehydrogenase small subunit
VKPGTTGFPGGEGEVRLPGIGVTVDGTRYEDEVDACLPLSQYLRERKSGGIPVDCPTAECGACLVLVDGVAVKSCLMLAVQTDGCTVTTVDGLADDATAHSLQKAFRRHVRRCTRCRPGLVVAAVELLRGCSSPSEQEIHEGLSGVRCPCGSDADIVRAVCEAADAVQDADTQLPETRVVG